LFVPYHDDLGRTEEHQESGEITNPETEKILRITPRNSGKKNQKMPMASIAERSDAPRLRKTRRIVDGSE